MKTNRNLSSYILESKARGISGLHINESVRNTDIERALKLINSFLKKRGIYTVPVIEVANVANFGMFMVLAYTNSNTGCAFCWRRGETTNLHSIMFTSDFDKVYAQFNNNEAVDWDVCVQLKGAPIARSLQIVADCLTGRLGMDVAELNKAVRDAQLWESLEEQPEDLLFEANEDAVIKELVRKRNNLYQKIKEWEKKGKDVTDLQSEYDCLKSELEDARISVTKNVIVTPIEDPTLTKMQSRFEEEEKALPAERFADMESYIHNVILGIDVSALICGAPGVGKTYRIMQAIKKQGMHRGTDYEVIKGKCTPLMLYTLLHDYQKSRQLLVIDDADDIITDDTSINLLKAATDSSEERVVSYGSSAAPQVPEEKVGEFDDFEQDAKGKWKYPKNFVYNGGVIIITNMNAGQIDTAIRSRAMICDLNFTTQEVLDLVRDLSPHIANDILTPESKDKALTYLQQMAEDGLQMEISIRSFTLVAKLYLSDAPENVIQRRIREQMKLKFLRGGKRY